MKILIVLQRSLNHQADAVVKAVEAELLGRGYKLELKLVPSALEIPILISIAASSGAKYAGYIAIGLDARDYSCNLALTSLMQVACQFITPIGLGISDGPDFDLVSLAKEGAQKVLQILEAGDSFKDES